MMMPANFSVMAENELVYVVGGSAVTDWAKTFNTNLVTIIGNSYVEKLTKATLGVMFGGAWGDKTLTDGFKAAYGKTGNGFNTFMQVIGTGAAIYQLGTAATGSTLTSAHKGYDEVYVNGEKVYTTSKKYPHVFGVDGGLHSVFTDFVDQVKAAL